MDTASIVAETLSLSQTVLPLHSSFIGRPLSTPPSPLFILLLACSALWLYSPKVRSLCFGSRIVTFFVYPLVWLPLHTSAAEEGEKHDNNPEATLITLDFLVVFNSLCLIPPCLIFNASLLIISHEVRSLWLWEKIYRMQQWKQDDMEGEAEEWVGWGPLVETLVRMTACEETAACQPDDCSCLPEHLMARQCHSVYGSRACLTSLLSMSPFYRFQQLVEDKSIGFPFESSGMNTGSVFIAWFLIDGSPWPV